MPYEQLSLLSDEDVLLGIYKCFIWKLQPDIEDLKSKTHWGLERLLRTCSKVFNRILIIQGYLVKIFTLDEMKLKYKYNPYYKQCRWFIQNIYLKELKRHGINASFYEVLDKLNLVKFNTPLYQTDEKDWKHKYFMEQRRISERFTAYLRKYGHESFTYFLKQPDMYINHL